jgi:hypothetical protein
MEETSGVLAEFLLLKRDSSFQAKEENTSDERDKKRRLKTTEISRICCKTALRSHCTRKPTVKVKTKEGDFQSGFLVYPTVILSRLVSCVDLPLFSFLCFVFQRQE